jgi:hypothetical protein
LPGLCTAITISVMTKAKKTGKRKILEIIVEAVLAIVLIFAGFLWLFNKNDADSGKNTPAPSAGERLTVEGEYACLPKEGPGPHTLECGFGLRTSDNTYYQLELEDNVDPSTGFPYAIGDRLQVSGTFRQDPDSIYTSVGILEVESVKKLE